MYTKFILSMAAAMLTLLTVVAYASLTNTGML